MSTWCLASCCYDLFTVKTLHRPCGNSNIQSHPAGCNVWLIPYVFLHVLSQGCQIKWILYIYWLKLMQHQRQNARWYIWIHVSKKLKPFLIWLRQLKSLLPAAIEFSSIPSVFYQHFFFRAIFSFHFMI